MGRVPEPSTIFFASGLRGVQSSGGKETRQNFGFGSLNSIPTSAAPLATGFVSTTVQEISSVVITFLRVRVCPAQTTSFNKSNPPCALTMRVAVSSANAAPFLRLPDTSNRTESTMRWLRL